MQLARGLEPIALRLARVDDCIYRIGDLASQWSLEGPLDIEQRRSGDINRSILAGIRPVPPMVWLLFSEAINHLRAALDNTVWYLLEQAQGPVTGAAATRVAMPNYADERSYEKWCAGRVKDGLPELSSAGVLGARIRSLQPFVDTDTSVPSMSEPLVALIGERVELAHPLSLLQAYSNTDKHRAIRLAAARSMASRPDEPLLGQDLRFRELRVGDVLATGKWGHPLLFETSTAVMMRRAEPYKAMVPPATELALLQRYVVELAIPTLAFGLAAPGALPPQVDLSDTGQTDAERLQCAGSRFATERLAALTQKRYVEAMQRGLQFPPVIDDTEEE